MSFIPESSRRKCTAAALTSLSALALLACSEQTPSQPAFAPEFSSSPGAEALSTIGWQEQARILVAANRVSATAATRVYAILSLAQYGALTPGNGRHAEQSSQGEGRGRRTGGAVARASATVLGFFFPAAIPALDLRVQQEAAASSNQLQFARGRIAGTQAGERMIAWAQSDRTADPWTGAVPVGSGLWLNNGPPVAPGLGQAKGFFLTSGDQFRPPVPPSFGSAAFLADLNEIRILSATRTPEQLAIAQFWNFAAGTKTSSGYWNELASGYVQRYRLNERAAARVFALMHAAMFDAGIGCWDAKYHYWLIRPSQADPVITLPIGLPNHPSYPSGHSCNSAAATTVLAHFFPEHRHELADQMLEAGLSRMYSGLHYRFDITAGQELGKSVAQLAIHIDKRNGLLAQLH
jgi:membrane-associated phospholipid phosphatase